MVKGGISTVVKQYEANGYFPVLQSRYLIAWEEKGGIGKITVALRAARQLLGLLLKREVKGIHLQGSCRASFFRKSLYIAIANLFGVPTIFHMHSGEFYDIYDASHNPLFKWWLRSTLYWHIVNCAADRKLAAIDHPFNKRSRQN